MNTNPLHKKTMLLMSAEECEKDRAHWLEMKQAHISGTDAGVIMGANPWKTPLKLYYQKRGEVPTDDISGEDAVHFGTILEDVVAREFMDRTEIKVVRRGTMLDLYDERRIANVDRVCVGMHSGLECKTTNAFNAAERADEGIPRHYFYQCLHYLIVMYGDAQGRPLVDDASWFIACLIGGQKFVIREIKYADHVDEAIELVKKETAFYHRIRRGDPPPVSDSPVDGELLASMNDGSGGTKSLGMQSETFLKNMQEIKVEMDALKKRYQYEKNSFLEMLGNAEMAVGPTFKVSFKMRKGRETVSMTDIKKHPDIYQALKAKGLVKQLPGSRALIIKEV